MTRRRASFVALAVGIFAGLFGLAWRAVADGGRSVLEIAVLVGLAANLPWAALSAANALVGLTLRLTQRDPAAFVLPAFRRCTLPPPPRLSTGIAVCLRDEDMDAVLPPLARLLDGLAAHGAAASFSLWLLSDTQTPELLAREARAVSDFRAGRADRERIHYRRRTDNVGFKAGNLMDFLDREGAAHAYVLCLDADSEVTAEAALRLVSCMEADAKLAIVQQLIVGRPATSAFPRLFQFGMRAGMRTWATGQAWWQGPHGPYWGHNAVLRVEPFRTHCRLDRLADGRVLLSHDQVEAVRLHAAGWKVMCLPEEEGSLESNPPALPEFAARDRRWAEGNMQYPELLFRRGMTWMGRWQLMQAILLFLGAPVWVLVLLLCVAEAALGGAHAPRGPIALAIGATVLAVSLPKLAGYLEVMVAGELAARYGGRGHFLLGAAGELLFTTLLAPVSTFGRALAVLGSRVRRGRASQWAAQNRAVRGVQGAEAIRLLWPHTAFGGAVTAVLAVRAPDSLPLALPFTLGLILAVPFCMATASPSLSTWLKRARVAATPEELAQAPTGRT